MVHEYLFIKYACGLMLLIFVILRLLVLHFDEEEKSRYQFDNVFGLAHIVLAALAILAIGLIVTSKPGIDKLKQGEPIESDKPCIELEYERTEDDSYVGKRLSVNN